MNKEGDMKTNLNNGNGRHPVPAALLALPATMPVALHLIRPATLLLLLPVLIM